MRSLIPLFICFPPSCPAPSGQNTAFNRSLVYRGTLTLHLLIASVMAFLGFDANLLGRPCDFGKSSREYLISPYSSYIIAGAHARTRSHARERVNALDARYERWFALQLRRLSGNRQIFSAASTELRRERLVFPQGYGAKMNGALLFCLRTRRSIDRPFIRRGRLKIGVAARSPNASSIRIDYRIYYDHGLVISQFAPLDN